MQNLFFTNIVITILDFSLFLSIFVSAFNHCMIAIVVVVTLNLIAYFFDSWKSNNYMGSNREKFDIAIAILKK